MTRDAFADTFCVVCGRESCDEHLPPTPPPAVTRAFPTHWRILDDVQLLELPDPDFLMDGFIQRRGVGIVYAPSGAGKTTFISALLTSLASGRPFYGHEVRQRVASVYVATEDAPGFKVRLRAAKRAAALPLDQVIGVFTFPELIDMRDAVSVAQFRMFLESIAWPMPLECIVVDTYAAATPGAAENSSEDTTAAMVHAQQWRDALDATIIYCHHTNAGGSRERGHSAMRGAADFMNSLTPVDDVIHVECSKQRNAPAFDKLLLKLTPGPEGNGCVLRLATDVLPLSGLSPIQAKVFGILRENFAGSGATKSEWQRASQDVAERSFHRACKVLEERGYVKQVASHFRVTSEKVAE